MLEVFVSPTTNHCYVPLLKNAHLWGEEVFSKLGFSKEKYKFDNSKVYIVFLRDPIDRWLSGLPEYLQILKADAKFTYYLNSKFKLDILHLDFIFNKIEFDAHTQGQFRYIRQFNPKLEHGKCIYFYLNHVNFADDVSHFVEKNFGEKISKMKVHSIKNNVFKMNIRKQLENVLKTNEIYKENLDKYFQEDYDFIKRCNFYNPNPSGL